MHTSTFSSFWVTAFLLFYSVELGVVRRQPADEGDVHGGAGESRRHPDPCHLPHPDGVRDAERAEPGHRGTAEHGAGRRHVAGGLYVSPAVHRALLSGKEPPYQITFTGMLDTYFVQSCLMLYNW